MTPNRSEGAPKRPETGPRPRSCAGKPVRDGRGAAAPPPPRDMSGNMRACTRARARARWRLHAQACVRTHRLVRANLFRGQGTGRLRRAAGTRPSHRPGAWPVSPKPPEPGRCLIAPGPNRLNPAGVALTA